ncbi:MAG: hypothetical protein JNL28_00910 [Planctomycetes bacterium]|nr:hypothetical protein [Planctomycetota bacterium]
MVGDRTSSTQRISAPHHALLVLAVVVCRILVARACPTYDDAFITYRYARNLAEGAGLVFNPGAAWEPILGTTTPLYALILAVFGKLGLDLVQVSLALNIALDAVTALLIPRLFKRARTPSVVALFGFAAFAPLVRISVGGMESPLFCLTGLLAVLAAAEDKPTRAGIWSGLTCLVRPEGVLLCVILLFSRWPERRQFTRLLVPIAVIGVISVTLLSLVYGTPIPQSVTAKSAMHTVDPAGENWVRLKQILAQSYLPHLVLIPLLPLVAYGAWRALLRAGALRLFSLWALAISASYLIARPHTWGWYYFVPLTAWVLWLALGSARLARAFLSQFGPALVHLARSAGPPAAAVLAMAAAAFIGVRYASTVGRDVYTPLAAWARETSAVEPNARVLANDIGVVGWYWRGTVLDSEGLVWPAALKHGSVNAILEAERPEYFVLLVERGRLTHFKKRADLIGAYLPFLRFNTDGDQQLAPSPDDLTDEWNPDYIVYKRRVQ